MSKEIAEENLLATAAITPEEIHVRFEGDRRERPRNGEVWTELERNVKTGRA